MALVLKDRISETTTTSGTGTITLAGATSGFVAFSTIGDGNTTYYCITDGSAWEVGLGTYTSSGNTLARTTVYSNSNGNTSPITLSGGIKNVFGVLPADGIITVSGTSIQVPGTAVLSVANGGTGSNTATFSGANITSINANNISSGTLAVARGGTGAATLDANNVILGNGTSAVQFVAPGANGNVLTSNGTTWTSAAAGGGSSPGLRATVFTGNGTFTIPTGVTQVKVTVVGAGGGIQTLTSAQLFSGAGAGATAFKWLTGLTPGNTLSVTVGAGVSGGTGGTSSIASGTQSITTVSATGGNIGNNSLTAQPTGGTATNGDINIPGSMGFTFSTTSTGGGGASLFSGTTSGGRVSAQASEPGQLYGGGACPGYTPCGTVAAVAGGSGIVIFEY